MVLNDVWCIKNYRSLKTRSPSNLMYKNRFVTVGVSKL